MVLRSMYLAPDLDTALGNRAQEETITKAELMRRFLQEGLDRPATRYAAYAAAARVPAKKVVDTKPAKGRDAKVVEMPIPRRRVASNRR